MTEFSHSAEINILPPPTTEEILRQLEATHTVPARFVPPPEEETALLPDTPEQAALHDADKQRATKEFWDQWNDRSIQIEADRVAPLAEIIPIRPVGLADRKHKLGRLASLSSIRQTG